MANTNVKQTRAPKASRQPKATNPVVEEPEVQTLPELESNTVPEAIPETVNPEPENVKQPEVQPEPEVKTPEPEAELKNSPEIRTDIYLVQKGEKYYIYRGTKRLSRILVTLEKVKLIAAGYGENKPTIVK